jgi:hypothetical protein
MAQIQYAGQSEASNRGLFSLYLADFGSMPGSILLPSAHFVAFLAADPAGVDPKIIADFAKKLLGSGCVFFCTWGPDCERVHDIFDEKCYENEPVILTTWYSQDTLDEALRFFVFNTWPADEYQATCRSALAISVGQLEWYKQIRKRFADPDALWEVI